jgi:hypothetical protein
MFERFMINKVEETFSLKNNQSVSETDRDRFFKASQPVSGAEQ